MSMNDGGIWDTVPAWRSVRTSREIQTVNQDLALAW